MLSRLRLVGVLRRETDPEDAIIIELMTDAAVRMTCPSCKSIGLNAIETESDAADEEDDWLAAVLCTVCRMPIDPERVDALPGVKQCVGCQGKEEAGEVEEEPDFCPKCGSLVELRVSRGGGIARYKQFCTAGCRI